MASTRRALVEEIRELRPEDGGALLEVFNQASADLDPDFRARTQAEWRWGALQNPAGLRATLGFDSAGRVLAQYAGLPQRLVLDGQETCITQGVDSFSAADARGLSRRGAFVAVGEQFARDYGGVASAGDPWMWGFPVPSARRVGQRFLGYHCFRAMPLLELDREPGGGTSQAEAVGWSVLEQSRQDFDGVFDELCRRYPAVADRRAAALSWRYPDHPTRPYQLIVSRAGTGSIEGYAVVSPGGLAENDRAILCDVAGPSGAQPALVRAAWGFAREHGKGLVCALPPASEEFALYQELGFRVRGSSLLMVGRSYDRDYPMSFWRQGWYTTLGDSDLC